VHLCFCVTRLPGIQTHSESTARLRKQLQAAKWKSVAAAEAKSQASDEKELAQARVRKLTEELDALRSQVSTDLKATAALAATSYRHNSSTSVIVGLSVAMYASLVFLLWLATSRGIVRVQFRFATE